MKILSWDIGIINLAFCIIDTDNKKILDWGIINLLEEEKHECYGFIDSSNNKSECKKKCNYYFQNGNDMRYFCTIHKNQYKKINKNLLELGKYKGDHICCKYMSSGKKCNKKGSCKLENEIVCSYHSNLLKKKNQMIKKIVKRKANKVKIGIIKHNLITKLEQNKHLLNVSYVVIENQPSLKNPKMKSVAETLYSWFLIRAFFSLEKFKIKEIRYLSPSNKLKINNDNIQQKLFEEKNLSKRYQLTKKMAIIYTRDIIKDDELWLQFLNNNNKKDDLCDSFLQGLYFINNKLKI